MDDFSFLWLKTSKAVAWAQTLSPVVQLNYRGQLHYKPLDPKPYVQVTRSKESITIDENDYDVYLLDCNNEQYEINDHVDITIYVDAFGIQQAYIRLKYLPLDYGTNLVCLKIRGTYNSKVRWYYSNPFLLTGYNSYKTTRIDYIETRDFTLEPIYNSARLSFYKNDYVASTEMDVYYQLATSQNVISKVNKDRRLEWVAEDFDPWHYIRLEEALYNSPCYFDFIRNYPAEALKFEPRMGDTGVSENRFITDPNEKDVINIPSIIIDIEPEPVPMLASTDVIASTSQLVSEIETP